MNPLKNTLVFEINDDSGFLAIVNVEKYKSFVDENWILPQLISHFIAEMNRDALILWGTGLENKWKVVFVNEPSGKESFREFSKLIDVTNGYLYLTNYEDLTMAAQFKDEKIPTKHNSALSIPLENGKYELITRQLFNPDKFEYDSGDNVNFEIVVTSAPSVSVQQIDRIFWWGV